MTDKCTENVDEGYGFYKEDCKLLGIKCGPHKRSQKLPLREWKGIPDITKCAEKVDSNDEDLLEDIQSLQEFDIRVCNVCYYHAQEDKLIQDILQVHCPTKF